MRDSFLSKVVKFVIAAVLASVALFLPYKARLKFIDAIAFLVHLPYVLFGRMVRYFFQVLEIDPNEIR
ncbi:hypothetical protein M1328_00770 [Patescibacteria group bacterium]|nr:hypothetical protein [Patescibacteria group bacterium]